MVILLRGCANRSWSARRPSLPPIAAPRFSDESPHDDDHLREGYPEVNDPPSPLGTPQQLLVGVVPGIGPLHYPALPGLKRCRVAFLGDLGDQSTLLQTLAGDLRVITTIKMHHHPLGYLSSKPLQNILQGGDQ